MKVPARGVFGGCSLGWAGRRPVRNGKVPSGEAHVGGAKSPLAKAGLCNVGDGNCLFLGMTCWRLDVGCLGALTKVDVSK